MKGWTIFVQSVRQGFGNFGAVLRIFLAPAVALVALVHVLGLNFLYVPFNVTIALQRGQMPWGKVAILALVSQVLFVWVAVAWHRFILKEVRPNWVWPSFTMGQMWAYFRRICWVLLLSFPFFIGIGFLDGLISAFVKSATKAEPGLGTTVFVILATIPLIALCYRLGTSLPAAAIGQAVSVSEAWSKTRLQISPSLFLPCFTYCSRLRQIWRWLGLQFHRFPCQALRWRLWRRSSRRLSDCPF